jgi:hypothetical protein
LREIITDELGRMVIPARNSGDSPRWSWNYGLRTSERSTNGYRAFFWRVSLT